MCNDVETNKYGSGVRLSMQMGDEMGLFDTVTFERGLDIVFPDISADPFEMEWESKSISDHHFRMDEYRVTANGRLLVEDAEYEAVPEEERPLYNEAIGGFESKIQKMAGSRRKVHQGWSDMDYHGVFEFYATIDAEYTSLEAKFTDGDLVEVRHSDR